MKKKMKRKLLLSYFIIIIVAVGISTAAFWSQGYSYISQKSHDYYLLQAKLLSDIFNQNQLENKEELEDFVEKYGEAYQVRLTLIQEDGEVLADSDREAELENHATREEVIQALKGESVSMNRYSKTMGQDYSYSAVPIDNGMIKGVLRVSLPLAEIRALDQGVTKSVIGSLAACIIVALILAVIFVKIISTPIAEVTQAAEKVSEGDYDIKIYTREKNELGRLAKSFNIMATNLKANIQKLTRRNIELEAMLGSMKSGVIAIDESNAILFHNQAFSKMLAQEGKDYVGKSLYNVMRNAVSFDAMDAVRKSKETEIREGLFTNIEDDTQRMIRVTATPLSQEEGKTLGVLLILEDTTKIKKLESIRSDFVSNVTHELKTPLTSIRGFIETLKNGAIKEEKTARKFLDIIDIEAERLYTLIQDILILSEIEQKKDYEVVPCSVESCIQSVIELLEGKLNENVTIVYNPVPYIKPYYCNPDRMKQLLINLLDNAMKYTEKGTITIACKEETNLLILNISDTGIGIKQEDLPRIFERFYRVDKSRSRKQGGTGLGLSIVKHIVELYNGNIHVESKLEVGTTFEIRLPY